jgi:predicted amidophosphoribosyltransferase
VVGRRFLIVDDVMTTGATFNECAEVLLRAGAREVRVVALARTLY